ncbi:hypothetical protein [Myroides odoratus]|uniref:hypothetical protein n=1 Tax=Myroides odoratus TaxID=256 RepID=UPI00334072DF
MTKGESLIKDTAIQNIDFKALQNLRSTYFEYLKTNPIVFPSSIDIIDSIKFLKRKNSANITIIGPYKNITVFEAANRIASDLVIINGLLELIETKSEYQKATFTLRLGITNHRGHGDFTISLDNQDYEEEAFNVAPSFLKAKLRNTINKWKDSSKLMHILINEDSFEKNNFKDLDFRVFKVKNWELLPQLIK